MPSCNWGLGFRRKREGRQDKNIHGAGRRYNCRDPVSNNTKMDSARSIIWSDCWKAYGKISQFPEGYKHGTVNHSTNFVDPDTGACTNRIESVWRHSKQEFPASMVQSHNIIQDTWLLSSGRGETSGRIYLWHL